MGQARDEAGNIWETDAQGNAIRLIQPAQPAQQGRVFRDPGAQAEVQQGNADARNANVDANVNAATANAQISQAQAQAEQIRLENERLRNELASGGVSADRRSEVQDRISRLNQLSGQINRVQELFAQGPGATSGVWSVADYLPSDANARFDTAGAALSQQGLAAFRVPGTGTVSDRDAAMFDRANLPTSSTRDTAIDEQLRGLRARVEEEYQTLGLPAPQWQGAPGPSAMDQTNVITPQANMQASGGTGRTSTPIPPAMQQEYQAWVLQNAANMTPESYVQFRQGLDRKYGFESGDYTPEATRLIDGVRNGGTLNLTIPPVEQPMTSLQSIRDMTVNNPFGAAAAGAANMGGFGGVEALGGDYYSALRDAQPEGVMAGEILGSIAPAAGIARMGGSAASRLAPGLLNGGRMAQIGRGAAADATYASIYGGVTGQNPLESAVEGGVGSIGGQVLGRGLGRAFSGVNPGQAVQRLYGQGVRPTLGQIARGAANGGRSVLAGMEDNMANSGWMGSFVNSARNRTLEQANLAGLNIGARGAGQVTEAGLPGINQLADISSQAYTDALDGVNVPMGAPEVRAAVLNARQNFAQTDSQLGGNDLGLFMRREIDPLLANHNIGGERLQDLMIANREASRDFSRSANMGQRSARYAADAVDEFNNELQDAVGNYAPDAIPALNEANRIYRNFDVLDNAAGAAANEQGLWTAAQLNNALKANSARNSTSSRGRGLAARSNQDLFQLQQDMAEVLPSQVPPTGVNAAPVMALIGAGAAGTGYATDNNYLAPAALLALAATPYTRTGQRVMASAITQRNPTVREFGNMLRRRSGLFGSAAVPLTLTRE